MFETGRINASDAAAIAVAWVDDSRDVQRVARAPKLTHAARHLVAAGTFDVFHTLPYYRFAIDDPDDIVEMSSC